MSAIPQTPLTGAAEFERRVLRALAALGRRTRLYLLIRGLALTLAFVLSAAALQFCIDYLLVLERLPRFVLLLMVVGIVAFQFRALLWRPLRAGFNPARLAETLERHHPALKDRLLSAVQFATGAGRPASVPPGDDSRPLMEAVIRQACDDARQIRPHTLLCGASARRHFVLLLAIIGAMFAAGRARPVLMQVYIGRNLLLSDVGWPRGYRIVLEGAIGGRIRWPRGDALLLAARVETTDDKPPRQVYLTVRHPDGGYDERPMKRVGENRFHCDLGPLDSSMTVRFVVSRWGTDQTSEPFEIEAIDRPSVRTALVRVTPAAYTRQPTYAFPAGQTSGEAPAGSRLRLEIELNKPVVSARLMCGGGEIGPAERVGEQRWAADVEPVRSAVYTFDVRDDMGLEDVRPAAFSIRLVSDRPPTVRVKLPGVGSMIVPNAVLPIVAEFEDNWGLATAEFEYQIDRATATSQPTPVTQSLPDFEPHQTRFTHRWEWDLAPLGLAPQNRLSVSARARDFKDFGDPNEGRSPTQALRVVTREELLADFTRREQEQRQALEQLIRVQEGLRARLGAAAVQEADADRAAILGREARAQRQLAQRVRAIQGSFEQILSESRINRLATRPEEQRLGDGIVAPLAELATVRMPEAADLIDRLSRGSGDADAARVDAAQLAVLDGLNAVLSRMLKWEGLNEAASMLREILKLQGDLNRQTQEELDRQIERLFGPQGK
ncbi:MAG: hypothetical protein L6R00_06210 [Phycisphaerae bacterium]|nr:hypothetical protein [Phycisphaerae bacterium]